MAEPPIDVHLNFKHDSAGRDPDAYSATLQRYHQRLWSKPLPKGDVFSLQAVRVGSMRALRHESPLGVFELSSDTLANSNRTVLRHWYDQMGPEANADWHGRGGSIGGRLVFPRNRVDGKQTLNQQRGTSPRIRDRFDLTLEAIRRHYVGERSPLSDVIARYANFFALFENFGGYVDFFLLNDLATGGAVRFFLPFRGFDASPLPQSFEEYARYRAAQLEFVNSRSERIASHAV